MRWLSTLRDELHRPTRPVDRREWPFLAVGALLTVPVAQWYDAGRAVDVVVLAFAALVIAVWPLLHRVPTEVVAIAVTVPVVLTVGRDGSLLMSLFLVLLMTLYASLLLGSTLRALLIAGFAGAVIWSVAAVRPRMYAWQPWEAGVLFTFVVGRMLQRQRTLIDQLEAAREALAVQAVTEERRKIARELHDLAGHTLAAMLLHVTGARHVLQRDRADAERALREAEAVGRASMDQIRATVALLRTTETGVDAALPDGASLPALIGEYERAGVSITSSIAPDVLALSGPVAVALHRIGREALANIARHAPRNAVEFEAGIDAGGDQQVRLRISDHGRRAEPPDPTAGRFGLVGMGERARSLGGSLVAAPTADGWRVEATFPLATTTGETG